jgi:NOL1/NOP2/sun family putative RNA methylase
MSDNIPIPPVFLERMARYLVEEFKEFQAALMGQPISGLRVNTLKLSADEFQRLSPFLLNKRVPWASSAYILPQLPFSLGLHPYHLAGLYYLQDPSAMCPAEMLSPVPGDYVLDLAASPGGKTTQLASLMRGSGLLVANEIKEKRVGHLAMNVERWGAENIVITNETPERLADHFGPTFDRVLVDAPCSGEGMFRKDVGARADWSPEMVAGCAIRQHNILRVAVKLVRPGGFLLYSTCTFAPEEDEEVILSILDKYPEYEIFPLPDYPGFLRGQPTWGAHQAHDPERYGSLVGAVRLFPHRVQGEGHFICLLKRLEDRKSSGIWEHQGRRWTSSLAEMSPTQAELWKVFSKEVLSLELDERRLMRRGERLYLIPDVMPDFGNLRLVHPGIWLGNFKKGRFEPAHPAALFLKASDVKNGIDFHPDDPLLKAYLRGETFCHEGNSGWTLVSVDGFGLGWGKTVQGLVKNHYPRGWM